MSSDSNDANTELLENLALFMLNSFIGEISRFPVDKQLSGLRQMKAYLDGLLDGISANTKPNQKDMFDS